MPLYWPSFPSPPLALIALAIVACKSASRADCNGPTASSTSITPHTIRRRILIDQLLWTCKPAVQGKRRSSVYGFFPLFQVGGCIPSVNKYPKREQRREAAEGP